MNLAYHDIRFRFGRFIAMSFGVALLSAVVLSMAGIYQGLVDDTTSLARVMRADLWVVQKGTHGPFADASRLDPTVESRVAAVPGVTQARRYSFQVVQRGLGDRQVRLALIGLAWPDDRGEELPLIAGRALRQAHGEMVVDVTLGFPIGGMLTLGGEEYRVVGITQGALTTGGDPAAFVSHADAQDIFFDAAPDAVVTERERQKQRLRAIDLGRSQPLLEELLDDPRWRAPAVAPSPIQAVLVQVASPSHLEQVVQAIGAWHDVEVFTQPQQEELLLRGVVEKARMQLGMFSVILLITSSVLFSILVYNMTLDKTHDIAVLKLMGAGATRIAGMVLQQSWLMGLLSYGIAVGIGTMAFPHFPRRVVITDPMLLGGLLLVAVITTVSSVLAVSYALRVDAGKVLEG